MVLDESAALFAEVGYRGTTMAAISKRMRISKAVLYDCFPGGKREILESLLARTEGRFADEVVGRFTPGEVASLERAIEGFLRLAQADAGCRLVFGNAGTTDRRIAARVERVRRRMQAAFAATIPMDGPRVETFLIALATAADLVHGDARRTLREDLVRAVVRLLIPSD